MSTNAVIIRAGAQGPQGSPGVTGVTGPTGSIGPQGIAGSGGGAGGTYASQATAGLVNIPAGDLQGASSTATTPYISSLHGDATGAITVPSGVFFSIGGNIGSSAATGIIRLPSYGVATNAVIPIIDGIANFGANRGGWRTGNILAYGSYSGANANVSVGLDLNVTNNNIVNIRALGFIPETINNSGSPTTISWINNSIQEVLLNGSTTFIFSNPIGVANLILRIVNTGTGGCFINENRPQHTFF